MSSSSRLWVHPSFNPPPFFQVTGVDVCKSMILEKLDKATKDTFASDILNAKVPRPESWKN